jgi:hypothetical protein
VSSVLVAIHSLFLKETGKVKTKFVAMHIGELPALATRSTEPMLSYDKRGLCYFDNEGVQFDACFEICRGRLS